jgi:hypothetical protein
MAPLRVKVGERFLGCAGAGVSSTLTGPGCGLSEVLITGDRSAALDDRAAPICPPGPVPTMSRASVSAGSCR